MDAIFAIFNFGKEDAVIFDGNNIDFIKESFVIFSDDLMTVFDQVFYSGVFTERAKVGGVFDGFFGFNKTRERFAGFKRFTVFWGEPIFIDGFEMRFGSVADVFVELIFWVFGG